MVKLRLTGEGFTKNLGEIVRESYKELLDTISVKDARLEDVVNYFVEKYEYSGDAANRATAVFAHLAQEGGIEISEQLSSRKSPQPKAKPQANQVRKDKGRATNDEERQQSTQSMPVTPSGVDLLQMGDVKIYLPKENPSAVEIARSLLDVYVRTKKE